MNDLTHSQLDRLESAHAVFEQENGVAKARLLAALTAEVPPSVIASCGKTRFEFMRKNTMKLAAASVLILAVVGGWLAMQPRLLFAQTVKAMIQAQGYCCEMFLIDDGPGGARKPGYHGRYFWSASGEERSETVEDDELSSIVIHRPDRTGLVIIPSLKRYSTLLKPRPDQFSFGLCGRLAEFRGKAEASLGVQELDGIKCEGFVVPWSSVIDRHASPSVKIKVWLDSSTSLPVRVDLVGSNQDGKGIMRLENFKWSAQDPSRFDTTPPAGFASRDIMETTAEEFTEMVSLGLSTFKKYNGGKYPAVKYVYSDQQGEALRNLMGMDANAHGWVQPHKDLKWENPKAFEFARGTLGLSWIDQLQQGYPDCVYNGKSVTPADAGKVLLRWKLDDRQYWVIFGDLKAESVSAERLKELEAK